MSPMATYSPALLVRSSVAAVVFVACLGTAVAAHAAAGPLSVAAVSYSSVAAKPAVKKSVRAKNAQPKRILLRLPSLSLLNFSSAGDAATPDFDPILDSHSVKFRNAFDSTEEKDLFRLRLAPE